MLHVFSIWPDNSWIYCLGACASKLEKGWLKDPASYIDLLTPLLTNAETQSGSYDASSKIIMKPEMHCAHVHLQMNASLLRRGHRYHKIFIRWLACHVQRHLIHRTGCDVDKDIQYIGRGHGVWCREPNHTPTCTESSSHDMVWSFLWVLLEEK